MPFNYRKNCKYVSDEIAGDILMCLVLKNRQRMEASHYLDHLWSNDLLTYIFNCCEELKLKTSVKYLSLEIYERFSAAHVADVFRQYSDLIYVEPEHSWDTIQERLEKQRPLRILSAIEIASKLESSYEIVKPDEIKDILLRDGEIYSLKTIRSSEQRLLITLKSEVTFPTPVEYSEVLLYILRLNQPDLEESFTDMVLGALEYGFLKRNKLYNDLYEALEIGEREQNFTKIKADYFLFAAAIIASTAYLFIKDKYATILELLHEITLKDKHLIKKFSLVISFAADSEVSV